MENCWFEKSNKTGSYLLDFILAEYSCPEMKIRCLSLFFVHFFPKANGYKQLLNIIY